MNAGKFFQQWFLAASLLLLSAVGLADSISATVDRRELSADETLRLVVRVSPQANQAPDFSLLEKQFDVLSRNQSSQYRNFNGQVEAFTEWQLMLAPKQAGKLLIPSFQFGNQFSDAIEVQVSEADASAAGLQPDVYLELTADLKTPYVQQQVLISLTLYTAIPLRLEDGPDLSLPGAVVVPLNQSQFQKRVSDKVYTVSERRYALFPQQSGNLEIPIQTLTVSSAGSGWNGYGRGQLRRLRSKPVTLEVKPQPQAYTGDHWLPATQLSIEDNLSSPQVWQVGEPVTRTFRINAEGVTGEHLAALSLPAVDTIKQYRETPEKSQQQTLNGVSSQITETVALVPTQAGEYELPGITLVWWDTKMQRERRAEIPPVSVTVEGSLPQQESTKPVTSPSEPVVVVEPGIWPWVSLMLALTNLLLLTLLLWFWPTRLRTSAPENTTGLPAALAPDWQTLLAEAKGVRTPQALAHWLERLNQQVQHCAHTSLQQFTSQHGDTAAQARLARLTQLAWREQAESTIDTNELVTVIESTQRWMQQSPVTQRKHPPVPDLYPGQR